VWVLAWRAGPIAGQSRPPSAPRVATTVGALTTYPVFFHTQPVLVRGEIRESEGEVSLVHDGASVILAGSAAAGLADDRVTTREVSGVFLDVGRLGEHDPRLTGVDVERLALDRLRKPWPGIGELLLINARTIDRAEPLPAPSIRALALDPGRYTDARVSLVGRFRGRNLYGDQPDAPGVSRWDFVLQAADASIWVVGRRPRGSGFNLNVEARVDTGRWLEVSGVVRQMRELVLIEAVSISLAEPPETISEPVARVPAQGPRPEVVFSAPTHAETDVSPSARVRIQFSRDLDPESFRDQVRVAYVAPGAGPPADAPPPTLEFRTQYDEGLRVLEVVFLQPLAPYRTLKVDLLDGIKATDGAQLVPWSLTFSVGS
jgi:hypothetical protein